MKPKKVKLIKYLVLILHNFLRSESTSGKIYNRPNLIDLEDMSGFLRKTEHFPGKILTFFLSFGAVAVASPDLSKLLMAASVYGVVSGTYSKCSQLEFNTSSTPVPDYLDIFSACLSFL